MKMIFRGQNMLFQYALTGDQYDLLTILWQLFCCCLYVDNRCCAHYAYYGCEYGKMFATEKDNLKKQTKKNNKTFTSFRLVAALRRSRLFLYRVASSLSFEIRTRKTFILRFFFGVRNINSFLALYPCWLWGGGGCFLCHRLFLISSSFDVSGRLCFFVTKGNLYRLYFMSRLLPVFSFILSLVTL